MKKVKYILLGISMLLNIVAQAEDPGSYPLDTINGKIYYRYTVPRGVGIYRIATNFSVSQEDILKANPKILTRGLHVDEEILIPTLLTLEENTPEIKNQSSANSKPEVKETLSVEQNVVEKEDIIRSRKPQRRTKKELRDSMALAQQNSILDSLRNDSLLQDSATHTIRIAVMLPLFADAVKRDKNMDRFFDFYAGILLAINEVQQEGQKIEVFTYDVDKTANATLHIMQDSTWQKVDAIIGPAYPQQVTEAVKCAEQDSTWILVPFLPTIQEIQSNPYILKFNPSTEIAAKAMAEYLATLQDSVNCVLIEAKETEKVPMSIIHLHEALKEYKVSTTTTTIRQIYTDSIDSVFIEGKENIVIFNTENYNNLRTIMPNLERAAQRYHVTLYSQYSWSRENILLPQIYTSTFNDTLLLPAQYDIDFDTYFGHILSETLPRYDLLGYDITLHLLRMLQQAYAKKTTLLPADEIWVGTQTTIRYKKVFEQGGYENQTIHIIRK